MGGDREVLKKWSCNACTYENWPRAVRCAMCQLTKDFNPKGSRNIYEVEFPIHTFLPSSFPIIILSHHHPFLSYHHHLSHFVRCSIKMRLHRFLQGLQLYTCPFLSQLKYAVLLMLAVISNAFLLPFHDPRFASRYMWMETTTTWKPQQHGNHNNMGTTTTVGLCEPRLESTQQMVL